jgi:hypothetical protein
MLTKNKRRVGVTIALLIGLGLVLSSTAMTPSQVTATPTISSTITNTETPTSTATSTQTPTSTPTPSVTPTYSIPEPLQTEIANVNEKLDNLQQNPFSTHGASIIDNLLAAWIFEVLSVFLGKKAVKVKIDQDKRDGKAVNKTLEDINIVLGYLFKVSFWLLVVLIIIWAIFTFGQPLTKPTSQSNLPSSSINSNQTETQNSEFPQPTPTPSDFPEKEAKLQYSLVTIIISSAIILLVLFTIPRAIARNQLKSYQGTIPKLDLQIIGRKLTPAGLLVLILLILPEPIDAFLSPIIVPYLLFAFFDIILLYPNSHLQDVVIKHYSKIIFLSVFGVWYSVFNVLLNYLYPFWSLINGFLQRIPLLTSDPFWRDTSLTLAQFIWNLIPLIFAISFALPPSRYIRKISEDKYIRRMINSGERRNEQE